MLGHVASIPKRWAVLTQLSPCRLVGEAARKAWEELVAKKGFRQSGLVAAL